MLYRILLLLLLLTLISTTSYNNPMKNDHYKILENLGDVEIRDYRNLYYASYVPKNESDRNNSFRNVAGYIFGGNNTKEKIAMTSPVVIKLHNKNEMAFIMPNNYSLENLPTPNNTELKLYKELGEVKAAIRYSGYSNKKKEQKMITELKEILKQKNIEHTDDFEVLVYNSPYQFINRRNEIVVGINYNKYIEEKKNILNMDKIYFGGGCFWCTEAIFEDVIGVTKVTSGYAGGKIKNPSYKEVASGLTEHAEVCEVIYDKKKIRLEDLLKIFFLSHDPTTLNRQGNDIGKHYRSIILYKSNTENIIIKNYIEKINNELFNNNIVTEVEKFTSFYPAEEYHQNYYNDNTSVPYCNLVITPKINKVKKELKKYYK